MVNGAFQIMQCQTNQLWLYLELNVILHDVLQLVSSSRGYLKWKRSTKHKLTSAVLSVKQLMSCSKEYRNNFQSPLSIVLYFPVTAHMLPHITPLNVFHSVSWNQQHPCFCSLPYPWITTVVHKISSNSTGRNLTGLSHLTKLAMSPVHLFLSTFMHNFLSSTHSTSAKLWKHSILCDFRLPPWCKWDQHSSGILQSIEW